MDLNKIPEDIQKNNQFCLWKYIANTDSTKKAIKKPYGFCQKTQKLVPSLKSPEYWLDWQDSLSILQQLDSNWGLGLVLNDGPYVAIDIDNCFSKGQETEISGDLFLILSLFQNAYIEISPSGCGLHIIFRGEWPYKQNKGVQSLDLKTNKASIEVYSGRDCRFITLTGYTFRQHNNYYQQLPCNFKKEMKFLFSRFFEREQNEKCSERPLEASYSHENNFSKDHVPQMPLDDNFDEISSSFLKIKQIIQNSKYYAEYKVLCDNNPGPYKSFSEADWHFCLFVLKFFTPEQAKNTKILEKFLFSERIYRTKLQREDYIAKTAKNAILVGDKKNSIGSFIRAQFFDNKKHNLNIEKKYILKICNAMHFFQLGHSKEDTKNPQIIKNHTDNYLEATIPNKLSSKDYDYYIQTLIQFASHFEKENSNTTNIYTDFYTIPINIKTILDNLNIKANSRAYKDFLASLDKLAAVTLKQKKKINTDGDLRFYRGPILSYVYDEKRNGKKKLFVSMNRLTIEILLYANHNYTYFNIKTYQNLESSQLRLLYNYFCSTTLPAAYPVEYKLEKLLQLLWTKCSNKETLKKRKKNLIDYLETLERKSQNGEIEDMNFYLIKDSAKTIGVSVKKNKIKISSSDSN